MCRPPGWYEIYIDERRTGSAVTKKTVFENEDCRFDRSREWLAQTVVFYCIELFQVFSPLSASLALLRMGTKAILLWMSRHTQIGHKGGKKRGMWLKWGRVLPSQEETNPSRLSHCCDHKTHVSMEPTSFVLKVGTVGASVSLVQNWTKSSEYLWSANTSSITLLRFSAGNKTGYNNTFLQRRGKQKAQRFATRVYSSQQILFF